MGSANIHVPQRLLLLLVLFASTSWARAQTHTSARLADGFDLPVGKPDAEGYYMARGFIPYGHAGEDWNSNEGGDSDIGHPVYSIAHGVVVYSDYCGGGFGESVIVRHAYREKNGQIAFVDSLYTHLEDRLVKDGQQITRGQLVGTIGKGPSGIYDAHLHFELRRDLRVGMRARMFPLTLVTYHRPEVFIKANRRLRFEDRIVKVPIHTFMKSDPNRVLSEQLDMTEVLPKREGTVRPVLSSRVEAVIEQETNSDEVTPEKTRAVFGVIFGK